MIAVVPVKYAATDSVWTREQFENWMRPGIDYSMGDFWWRSSRGHFDVSSQVFDPITIHDQGPISTEAKRNDLHELVVKTAVQVDFAFVDVLLIWMARPTGWWGGYDVLVPSADGGQRVVKVTVVDSITPFDVAAEELGHSFGLAHELGTDGSDYGSPYSSMSARTYGPARDTPPSFLRLASPKLPDGGLNKQWPYVDEPANRIIGPMVCAAQLHRVQAFRDSSSVVNLRDLPATVRLYALNYMAAGPGKPVLISFPRKGRVFFVELRQQRGYDQGITYAAVVVHSKGSDGLIRYEGAAKLVVGDRPFAVGDFALRILGVGSEFVDVEVRAGAIISFPIRGVLLAGGFRTQHQLNLMLPEEMRNTLIVEMTGRTEQDDYQRFDSETLAGMGAVLVFLRRNGLRDDAALKTMTADDMRNVLIVELGAQTGLGRELQGYTNLQLVQIGLGSDLARHGVGTAPFYVRGVLLAGRFRTQHQLNTMSHDDMRNTLIVVMTSLSNQTNYQAYNDADLAGVGAVMVFLRENGLRGDADLKKMSADDQRNVAIVELKAQTGRNLQGLSNLDLALAALGVERF
ncbi:hypothetical protein ABZX92_06880 [Lentzea sp. NPDC006480]|uniref:hypothetical protein n=1 Tax=Lentzea sp. NPDC006480 TaxID=3157176 RepID=UPI0033B1D80B